MSKKKCCCAKEVLDEWCNHDHYSIDWYEENLKTSAEGIGFNPTYFGGALQQCKQKNWKTVGTLTTELPSIGHPMTSFICDGTCPDNRIRNGEAGTYQETLPCGSGVPENFNSFRTPSGPLNNQAYGWGKAAYYGDISPCWFNGINMTNIENEDDVFFNITFKLKIEKLVGSSYTTIIDTKVAGPARNIRPHPDTVRSYNVSTEHLNWAFQSGCGVFFEQNDDNGPLPCSQDFARMPRGPWPYRLKRKFDVDLNNQNCYYEDPNNPGVFCPYTADQVKELNITDCPLNESVCNPLVDIGCCTKTYLDNKQFCNQLDEEGTPYGWEDCPAICVPYSNHSLETNTNNLKFFGWIEPANRYTTPEWDVEDIQTEQSRKMSLHVLVPTQFPDSASGFCYPDITQGRSFGEWSFGMDCEATNNEIEALESSGYTWSNGREKDGIWIHKTPTNALRLLFTLDHADLDQGCVWRVFKDWNVKVTDYVKVFNQGTANETRFRINIEQILEEKYLSSLGCDCPSGYRQKEDGSLERITPGACDDQITGFDNDDPQTCGGNCAALFLHCMNNLNGTKISFSERGPIVLQMNVETSGVGCVNCGDNPNSCTDSAGGSTEANGDDPKTQGAKFVIHSGPLANYLHLETIVNSASNNSLRFADTGSWNQNTPGCFCSSGGFEPGQSFPSVYDGWDAESIPSEAYTMFRTHGYRYSGGLGDLPFPAGQVGSPIGGKRYRNNYAAINQSISSIRNEEDGFARFGFYPHLYGDSSCIWTAPHCPNDGSGTPIAIYDWPTFNVKADEFPENAPVGNCVISCDCKLPGEGCQNCGNNGGGGPPGGVFCRTCPCDEFCNPLPDCPPMTDEELAAGCSYIVYNNIKYPPCQNINCNRNSCRCECQQGCNPPNSNPAIPDGPYRFPYDECRQNIGRLEGRGVDDPFYTCSPRWATGALIPFLDPPPGDSWFGMDSERIYFQTDGSIPLVTGLGDSNCWDAAACSSECVHPDCTFQYCEPYDCFTQITKCTFCEAPGTPLGYALGNMFFNWRKYLCQKRTKENVLPDLKAVEKLEFECTINSQSCGENLENPDESEACNHLWRFQTDDAGNVDVETLKNYRCNTGILTPMSIKVKMKKYDIPSFADNSKLASGWLSWNTKYKPNPGRNSDRSHIVITARGLD